MKGVGVLREWGGVEFGGRLTSVRAPLSLPLVSEVLGRMDVEYGAWGVKC